MGRAEYNSDSVRAAAEQLVKLVSVERGQKLSYKDIPRNVTKCMAAAQAMSELTGKEKQAAVTKAIQMAVDRSDVAGPLEGVVLEMVPVLIDAVVDVDKGRLVISKRTQRCFFSCFNKK